MLFASTEHIDNTGTFRVTIGPRNDKLENFIEKQARVNDWTSENGQSR